jgi:hypothetical protein
LPLIQVDEFRCAGQKQSRNVGPLVLKPVGGSEQDGRAISLTIPRLMHIPQQAERALWRLDSNRRDGHHVGMDHVPDPIRMVRRDIPIVRRNLVVHQPFQTGENCFRASHHRQEGSFEQQQFPRSVAGDFMANGNRGGVGLQAKADRRQPLTAVRILFRPDELQTAVAFHRYLGHVGAEHHAFHALPISAAKDQTRQTGEPGDGVPAVALPQRQSRGTKAELVLGEDQLEVTVRQHGEFIVDGSRQKS